MCPSSNNNRESRFVVHPYSDGDDDNRNGHKEKRKGHNALLYLRLPLHSLQ
jgi:hypothetical protein